MSAKAHFSESAHKMKGAFCMVYNSDTLYFEGPNSLKYPFVMMGEKLVLRLDKRDHNSTVVVMYGPYVGMILAF
jgi:hypothetical protein